MALKYIILAICLVATVYAQTGTPGTMLVYDPRNYNASTYLACYNTGWNPNVSIPNGQAIMSGDTGLCSSSFEQTSDYNRAAGVKVVVKVVAVCTSGCDTFQVSSSDFESISPRGNPPGDNNPITYVSADIPGTMLVYDPKNYNPSTYTSCPGSEWNPNVAIPNGQAVFLGNQSSCGVSYDLTSSYNRVPGVKATVKVVAICPSGCDNFQVSSNDFESISPRGNPPGDNNPITYVRSQS